MSIREIFRKKLTNLRRSLTGETDVQELMDKNQVRMMKTKEFEADDHGNKVSWSYRFKFDNQARKRRFLQAVGAYPTQDFDEFVEWFDDISNLVTEDGKEPEICVEARVLVDPEQKRQVQYRFEQFIQTEMIIKG